jgi:hypothetical protein
MRAAYDADAREAAGGLACASHGGGGLFAAVSEVEARKKGTVGGGILRGGESSV